MTRHAIDSDEICAFMKDVALVRIKPRFNALRDEDVKSKKHADDLVTIADIEAERDMTAILLKRYPGCVVIGEESVSSGAMTMDSLRDPALTIFVIDPVDGTYNFRHGKREFAMMIAMVQGGQTRMGWIYDVMGDVFAVTEAGAGAFLDGRRMQVAGAKSIEDCDAFVNPGYFPGEMRKFLAPMKAEAARLKSRESLRCAAHEYLRIADGRADFSISGWLNAWDHLAGDLMVREAGGHVMKWDASPYIPTDTGGGLIAASNATLANAVRAGFILPVQQAMHAAGVKHNGFNL